jgi:hypothetical protein
VFYHNIFIRDEGKVLKNVEQGVRIKGKRSGQNLLELPLDKTKE